MTRTPAEILAEFGIRDRRASVYATTCPRCSEGRRKKRAQCLSVLINDRGVFTRCHHCGWRGGEFFDVIGGTVAVPRASAPDNNANGRRALEIWRESKPLLGSPGEAYLRSRKITGLPPRIGEALRFHPRCPFGPGERHSCIVGLMVHPRTNEPRAIHRTALTPDGRKVEVLTLGRKAGACIKLSADDEVEQSLTIAEGLETGLSAWLFGFRPTWVTGDAGNLREFPVLSGIEHLTVVVDNDPPDERGCRKGPEATADCSVRWTRAGRPVSRIVPRKIGSDFNDVVREETK